MKKYVIVCDRTEISEFKSIEAAHSEVQKLQKQNPNHEYVIHIITPPGTFVEPGAGT